MQFIYGSKIEKVKEWIKFGIEPNDKYWGKKLDMFADYYENHTTYAPLEKIDRIKKQFQVFFDKLPDFVVEDMMQNAIHKAKEHPTLDATEEIIRSVTIYVEELDLIQQLKTYNQQKFAFVLLVNSKYGYLKYRKQQWIDVNMKFYLEQAGISLGGGRQKELIRALKDNGFLIGGPYSSAKNKRMPKFKVKLAYQLDEGTEAFKVTDFDNMLLYYRRYIGDEKVGSCDRCGEPVVHNIRKKHYCNKCTLSHNTCD